MSLSLYLVALLWPSPSTDLAADSRLHSQIEARANAETFESLLTRLGETLGVELTASPKLDQDQIILHAKKQPAHKLLKKISDHFGWDWEKTKAGYRLVQSGKEETREKLAAIQQSIHPIQRDAQKAALTLKGIQSADPEKRMSELRELLQKPSAGDAESLTPDEMKKRSSMMEGIRTLRHELDPMAQLCLAAMAALTQKDAMMLEEYGRLVFALAPKPLQLPMSPYARSFVPAAVVHRGTETPVLATLDFALVAEDNPLGIWVRRRFAADDVTNVRVEVSAQSPIRAGASSAGLVAKAVIVGHDGAQLALCEDVRPFPLSGPDEGASRPLRGPQPGDPAGFNDPIASLRSLESLMDAVMPVRGSEAMAWLGQRIESQSAEHPYERCGAVLLDLAEMYEASFISDTSENLSPRMVRWIQGRTPRMLLESVSQIARLDMTVDKEWVSLRTKDWELARQFHVPPKTHNELARLYRTQGFSLGLASDALSKLNRRQALSLSWDSSMPKFASTIRGNKRAGYYALSLYSGLAAADKLALHQERRLAYGALSPMAREKFSALLLALDWGSEFRSSLNPDEDDDSVSSTIMRDRWAVTDLPVRDMLAGFDSEITERLTNGIPTSATIDFQTWDSPAVSIFVGERPPVALPLLDVAHALAFVNDTTVPLRFRPAISQKLAVSLSVSDSLSRGLILQFVQHDVTKQPTSFEGLDLALRTLIQKKINRIRGEDGSVTSTESVLQQTDR